MQASEPAPLSAAGLWNLKAAFLGGLRENTEPQVGDCFFLQGHIFLLPRLRSCVTPPPASLRYTGCLLCFCLKESLSSPDLVSLRSEHVVGGVGVGGGRPPVDEICRKDQVRMDPEATEETFKQTGNESETAAVLAFFGVWSWSVCVSYWRFRQDFSFILKKRHEYKTLILVCLSITHIFSYWDTAYDSDVMDNRVGLNLLYAQVRDLSHLEWSSADYLRNLPVSVRTCVKINLCFLPHQTVSDIERGWILVNKDQHRQLKSLQEKGSKKEVSRHLLRYFCLCRAEGKISWEALDACCSPGCPVSSQESKSWCTFSQEIPTKPCHPFSQFIHLGQTLKYYGYIKFDPCVTDFPEKGCQVIVSAGNNELNFHVKLPNEQMKEGSFKVTRMRCWRVTSSVSVCVCVGVWGRDRRWASSPSSVLWNVYAGIIPYHQSCSSLSPEPVLNQQMPPHWRVTLLPPCKHL